MKLTLTNFARGKSKVKIFSFLVLFLIVLTGCSVDGGKQILKKEVTINDVYDAWMATNNLSYDMKILLSDGVPPGGDQPSSFKLYSKDKNKTRMEVSVAGQDTVFINNIPENIFVLYYPQENTYIDFGTDNNSSGDVSDELNSLFEELKDAFKVEGRDEINGREAVRLEGVSEGIFQKIWVDSDFLMPVKFQTLDSDGNVVNDVELQNLSTDSLDDELFTIPDGAKSGGFEEFLNSLIQKE